MEKIPVKNLLRVSLIIPVCISILIGLTSSAKDYSLMRIVSKSGFMFGLLLLVGMYNVGIQYVLSSRMRFPSCEYKIARYATSYIIVILISYLLFEAVLYTRLRVYTIPEWYLQVRSKTVWCYLFIMNGVLINTFIAIIHNFVNLQYAKNNAELENERLKFANTEAINQLLRQQIHPHFLFNALNTLKALIRRHPDKAEEYLIHLSDFLRASISKGQQDIISLRDEIKLSVDYLEMQKMRAGDALKFAIQVEEEALVNRWLPAFSLQPLLENAIKHNVLTAEDPLWLDVKQEGEYLKVSNNIQLKHQKEVSTGSGLMNLAERYRMLAAEEVLIEDDGKIFTVKIKILNNAGSHHRR